MSDFKVIAAMGDLFTVCVYFTTNMFVIFQSDISLRCSFPLTNTILFFKVGQGARATSVNGFFLDYKDFSWREKYFYC